MVKRGGRNLDLKLLTSIYDPPAGTSPRFLPQLLDIDKLRLAEMDAAGVDMHLLSLTAPGVQMFSADVGTALARLSNDRLAEIVRRNPTRFAALASFAPQDTRAAAKEMERAINTLKLNGSSSTRTPKMPTLTSHASGQSWKRRRHSMRHSTFTREHHPMAWQSRFATTVWRALSGVMASKSEPMPCA